LKLTQSLLTVRFFGDEADFAASVVVLSNLWNGRLLDISEPVIDVAVLTLSNLRYATDEALCPHKVANSGNFIESAPLLWRDRSAFAGFLAFADWLYARTSRTWGIPLTELAESVFRYLVDVSGQDPKQTADTIWRDYQRGGRPDRPAFLSPYVEAPSRRTILAQPSRARRQARHQLS